MTEELEEADREERQRAAELIHAYLAGEIVGGKLEEDWPDSSSDRALVGIGEAILPEVRGGTMEAELDAPTAGQLRQVLKRCELFLATDLPYRWGALSMGSCVTYGCGAITLILVVGAILAGLQGGPVGTVLIVLAVAAAISSIPARRLTAKADAARLQSLADGRRKHWPFESEAVLAAVREGKDPWQVPPEGELEPWDRDLADD